MKGNRQFLRSDLVGDAEDLVARVAHSQTPEVRELSDAVQRSVDLWKERLRSRARGLRAMQACLSWRERSRAYVAVGALLTACVAPFLTEVEDEPWQNRATSIRPWNLIGTG